MQKLSTREAAKKLGISPIALSRYICRGKVPAPKVVKLGRYKVHIWTEAQVEQVRQLLPKIANGRKTRWQKVREKQKAQAGVPVRQKKRQTKKKKKTR